MTRRRFYPTSTPMVGIGRSTRAQSVARSTFAPTFSAPPPRRRAFDDDIIGHGHIPFKPLISHASYGRYIDTTGSENFTRSEINRELMMTSAAMEDNYDIVNMSRSKDKDVLSRANRAITADQTPTRATGGTRQARGRSSLRRSQLFASTPSTNIPPTPTYKTTTTVVPLDLSSPERPSPYLTQANRLHTNNTIREGSYQPLYSRPIRTSVSPERPSPLYTSFSPERSYFRSLSRSISPYRSPSRDTSPLPIEESSLSRRAARPVRKRPKPRVVASKRKMGNYYNRLLNRKATQPSGAEGKYWPYIDVEDIQDTYTGDLFSDTESLTGGGDTYVIASRGNENDYQPSYSSEYQPSYSSDYQPLYSYEYQPSNPSYSYADDDLDDIPTDYIPFRPKLRSFSPERDFSKLSVVPYLPKRDPSKNSAADDIAFNAIVAASAERARKALERVSLDDYDDASLVLSVEGEYKSPSSDIPLGFRYISRPIALKEPASRIVSAYDSDNSFTKYMKDLQSFREGIRARLEEGYRALDTTYKSHLPAITASHVPAVTSSRVPAITSSREPAIRGAEAAPLSTFKPYHTRLRDTEGYKYSHSLELYPVTSRDTTLALPSSREAIPETHAIRLYDSSFEPSSKMSTIDKIQIKAALLGRKVDVVTPAGRRRPKSQYAQNKMREMRKEHRESNSYSPEDTHSLRASRPVHQIVTQPKPYVPVAPEKKKNLLSWQPFQLVRRIWDPELSYKTYRLTA